MKPSKITAVFEALLADLGSDASRRGYRSDWSFFLAWLKRQKIGVLQVTPRDVKKYMLHLSTTGKAQRTRGRALSVIREVYRAFVAEELLKYNPAREVKDVRKGKTGKPVTWLEEEPLAKFLAFGAPDAKITYGGGNGKVDVSKGVKMKIAPVSWTDRRDRMCIQLLAGTGRRRAEVARMRFEDFTEEGVKGIVKGGAEKTAPVPTWLRKELAAWSRFAGMKTGPVLPRGPEDREAITGDMVYLIVKRVAGVVGIDPKKISPHGIRRSLATLSDRRGVPLKDIQAQLNHSGISVTEHYLHGSRKIETAPGEWMSELVKERT